ncbi:inositol monophosphatase 1-like isoform X2 [Argiope bruennichi]|uniref:inositol monophosphatase 1-like isoform X2 n=1 Tax=Argiope bruennichi TaxID=94029 RepID=UPI00249440EE|nr:inositol monophosphatase 1-like isoform X2 [Argiope bruennichi]
MASLSEIDEYYDVAVELARAAGEVIRKAIDEKKNVETKESNVDLVTETDKKIEELLKVGFSSKFPDHCFIGEESEGSKLTDAPTWIIDPVDGTMNFVHRFPYNAISIGLAVNKQIVLGVVYNPILDRMYTGIKGKGAFLNGKRLQVSNVEELSQALVITEFGSTRTEENMNQLFTNIKNIVHKAHGVRMMGSAALNMCAVAAGEADAYFEYTIHCWDMAAGKIIVEEAGGTCIDPEGQSKEESFTDISMDTMTMRDEIDDALLGEEFRR